jgi:hypothetical protein
MPEQLLKTVAEYRFFIMLGLLTLLIIFNTRSTGRNRFVCLLTALLALSIGYELAMDEPVTRLPQRINHFFNHPSAGSSQNIHYYKIHGDPELTPEK